MKNKCFIGLCVLLVSGMLFSNCDTGNGGETTTYTVTFNSNGGSAVEAITGISSGATIQLPQNPTKTDCDFEAWYIDNGTFQNQFTSSTIVTQSLTVSAKWLSKYRGIWIASSPATRITIDGDLVFIIESNSSSTGYVNIEKGTLSISGPSITFTVTHAWDNGTWTTEQSKIDALNGFNGGSSIITGTVNGYAIGSKITTEIDFIKQ
jgi:uncharacterized repeat protein (TIGR02543 family)